MMMITLTLSMVLVIGLWPSAVQVRSAQQGDARRDKEALFKLIDEITKAKAARDISMLDHVLAEDYIFTNPAGLVANKAEYLDGARIDTATYESVTNFDQVCACMAMQR